MEDIFGNTIHEGDICAISTRIGKHDTCIKVFYVASIHQEENPDTGETREYLRGYDGAGCLTQVQKAHNIAVVNGSLKAGNPRLKHIMDRLSERERHALCERLGE